MQLKHILSLLPLIAVAAASPQNPPTPRSVSTDANTPKCPDYCAGTAYNSSLTETYVCGDARLGLRKLPTGIELGDLFHNYERYGNLCPGQFLAKWYNSTAGAYTYPHGTKLQLNTDNLPIEGNIILPIGFQIDRFGSEYNDSAYISPRGSPFRQRSLPPNYVHSSSVYPYYNYHVYTVIKPFEVLTGPIAGWFEQPGQGVQYHMSSNVMTMVAEGFLERVF